MASRKWFKIGRPSLIIMGIEKNESYIQDITNDSDCVRAATELIHELKDTLFDLMNGTYYVQVNRYSKELFIGKDRVSYDSIISDKEYQELCTEFMLSDTE